MANKFVVLQTCVPDYRVPVFNHVHRIVPEFSVLAGTEFFTREIRTANADPAWLRFIHNSFIFGRSLLWQSGVINHASQADVVVAELNPRILSTWILLCIRGLAGRRTVLWGHAWSREGRGSFTNKLRLLMARRADAVVCYTNTQASELRDLLPNTEITAAPNSCVRRSDCGVLPDRSRSMNVLCVGRLDAKKKPTLLVEAFAIAAQHLPTNAKLIFVGEGPERDAITNTAKRLNIDKRVCLMGHINDLEKLKDLYNRAAVAVSPGYVGLSAIQCMAFGVPMLVSRSEPHAPEIEACIDGETCCFFRTDDAVDLANELLQFMSPNSIWRERALEIATFIQNHYTIDSMAEALVYAALGRSR